jgi:hypothetical protein
MLKAKIALSVVLIAILALGTGFSAYLLSQPSPIKLTRKPLKLEVKITSVVPILPADGATVAIYPIETPKLSVENYPVENTYNVTVVNLGDPCNVTVFGEANPQMYSISAKLPAQNQTVEKLIHLEVNEEKTVLFKFDVVSWDMGEPPQFWTSFSIEQ